MSLSPMQFSFVAGLDTGSVRRGQLVAAEIDRGVPVEAVVPATADGTEITLRGADLRLQLLRLHNPFEIEMAHIGVGQWATTLSSSHGSVAWTDGEDFGRGSYRLFSREVDAAPELTRWARVGMIGLEELLGASLHGSARKRAFRHLVEDGLPSELVVRVDDGSRKVQAPAPGWLALGDGLLSDPPDQVPVYAVDVVASWPGEVSYPGS